MLHKYRPLREWDGEDRGPPRNGRGQGSCGGEDPITGGGVNQGLGLSLSHLPLSTRRQGSGYGRPALAVFITFCSQLGGRGSAHCRGREGRKAEGVVVVSGRRRKWPPPALPPPRPPSPHRSPSLKSPRLSRGGPPVPSRCARPSHCRPVRYTSKMFISFTCISPKGAIVVALCCLLALLLLFWWIVCCDWGRLCLNL